MAVTEEGCRAFPNARSANARLWGIRNLQVRAHFCNWRANNLSMGCVKNLSTSFRPTNTGVFKHFVVSLVFLHAANRNMLGSQKSADFTF